MKIEFTSEKRERKFGGWTRTVRVDGLDYSCIVEMGRSVRIPYKPRGQNRGHKWHGSVYHLGRCLWHGQVSGSIGCRGLLIEAGVLTEAIRLNRPASEPQEAPGGGQDAAAPTIATPASTPPGGPQEPPAEWPGLEALRRDLLTDPKVRIGASVLRDFWQEREEK